MTSLIIEIVYDGNDDNWSLNYDNTYKGLELITEDCLFNHNDNTYLLFELECALNDVNVILLSELNPECTITVTYEVKESWCDHGQIELKNGKITEAYELDWVKTNVNKYDSYMYKE